MIDVKELFSPRCFYLKSWDGAQDILQEVRVVGYSDGKAFVKLPTGGIEQRPLNCIEPIPLTEELLIKCGFVQVRWDTWNKDDFFVYKGNNGFGLYVGEPTFEDARYLCEIKHLHTLQNAVALTGKELEVKL
jgi:hypothetical protein